MEFKDLDRIEIRFCGTGGQGLVLASFILADAMMMSGYHIIQGASHGIEVRGGISVGELIASKGEIYDLMVREPNIFIAISQESCDKYYKHIYHNALVILDSALIQNIPSDINSKNVFTFPFNKEIKEKLGTTLAINMAFLGTLVELSNIVTPEYAKEAITRRVTKESKEVNLKAFDLGINLAKNK